MALGTVHIFITQSNPLVGRSDDVILCNSYRRTTVEIQTSLKQEAPKIVLQLLAV